MSEPMQKSKYFQKYRTEWEEEEEFKEWIQEVPDNPRKAYCRFCEVNIVAKRSILMKHTSSHIHKANKISCPVCDEHMSYDALEDHVHSCLNSKEKNSAKRKKAELKSDWRFLQQISDKLTSKNNKKNKKAKSSSTVRKAKKPRVDFKSENSNSEGENDVEFMSGFSFAAPVNHSKTKSSHTIISEVDPFQALESSSKNKKSVDNVPIAEKVRPKDFGEFIGQTKAVGKQSLLYSLLTKSSNIPSMILWGPPGCGKTTIAKIIANDCRQKGKAYFLSMSGTSASVNDIKEAAKVAKTNLKMFKKKTVLFLDEIHRFNKLQQDVLLPHVEDGTITLIGATTENPSFQVNGALLSRCLVITLEKLQIEDLEGIIRQALKKLGISIRGQEVANGAVEDEHSNIGLYKSFEIEPELITALATLADGEARAGLNDQENSNRANKSIVIEPEALKALTTLVDGDARAALNGLQMAMEGRLAEAGDESEVLLTLDNIKDGLQSSHVLYDRAGEEHYNIASALIKSMRGSDDNAALYWLARMLQGGENPLFIARRLVVFASEDVGIADPQALSQAVSTFQACQFLGMPECKYNLAQCVVYLARVPKSTEVTTALRSAEDCIKNNKGPLPSVPLHLRNASTKLMNDLGYDKGYNSTPVCEDKIREYLPPSLKNTDFFNYHSKS